MKIYDTNGTELLDVRVTSSARHEEEMGKSDFVRLSWRGNVKRRLGVGTYIVPFEDGLKYRLVEPYEPQQDAEDTFTYQPEFQHPLMWLSKVPFTYATKNTLGEDVVQQEWEYTGLTSTLLQYAADFINDAFGLADSEKFSVGMQGSVDTNVSVSFSSSDVLSALTAIANACAVNKCEWHLSWPYKKLYFGQVSVNYAETVPTLEVGANVGKASVSAGGDGYYNVFFPQGSTRNMSAKAASGENVSTGIRLGLDKAKYPDGMIDTRTNSNEPKQTLALTFDDVYPHVDCYAYNVRPRTRYLLDDDGNKVVSTYNPDGSVREYKKYTVWYMRLAYPVTSEISGKTPVATTTETLDGKEQTLYWYDYVVEDSQILDGYTLCGSFSVNTNDGALASSLVAQPSNSDGFELIFHKTAQTISANSTTGDSGVSILAGDFEIVFVNQNETIIPTNESEGLVPRGEATPSVKGNIVILYNIAMGDDEVAAAQDELESETLKEIAYRQSDLNNYTFNAYPQVWAKSNPKLYVGQRVVYDDGNGYSYTTRVMKLVTNLDYDIVQEITVGNSTVRGAMSQLKEDVKTIMSGNWAGTGGGLSASEVLAVVRNYATPRFLSKQNADTAQGLIRFLQGLGVGDGGHGIDGKGVADLARVVAGELVSRAFGGDDIIGGKGFHCWTDDGGRSHVITDYFTARVKALFSELEIRKVSASVGNMVFSNAGSRLAHVEGYERDGYTGWKCWFETDDGTTATTNSWEIGDMAQCRTFNVKEGAHEGVGNRYYWRLVIGKGEGQILDKDGVPVDDKAHGYVILADHYTDADGHSTTLVETLADGDGNEILPYGGTDGGTAYFRLRQADGLPEGWAANDAPEAGDSIAQLGCQTAGGVATRGNAMQVVTNGDEGTPVPSLNMYSAINDYDLSRFRVIQISPNGIVATVRMSDITVTNGAGKPVSLFNFVGAYPTDGAAPIVYKGDVYTHGGQTWAWDGADGSTPGAPSEEVAGWTLVASKGADGSAAMDYYEITAEPSMIHLDKDLRWAGSGKVEVRKWHVVGAERTEVTGDELMLTSQSANELDTEFALPIVLSLSQASSGGTPDDLLGQTLYEDIVTNGDEYIVAKDINGDAPSLTIPVVRDGSAGKDGVPTSVSRYAASAYNAKTVEGNTHGGSGCPKDIEDFQWYKGWTYKTGDWGGWQAAATVSEDRPYLWMVTVGLDEDGGYDGNVAVCYACLTGADGEDGEDTITLECDPAAVVWNQGDDGSWPEVSIKARLTRGTEGISGLATWEYASLVNVGWDPTQGKESSVTLSSPKADSSGGVPTQGSVTFGCSYGGVRYTRTVPVGINALGTWKQTVKDDVMESVSEKVETEVGDMGELLRTEFTSSIEQTAGSIGLKVDQLAERVDGIGAVPSANLVPMGCVGEVAVTGQNVVWGPRKVAVTAGKRYTVTWRGRVGNAEAYVKFYASVGGWGSSSPPYSDTEEGTFRHVFTPGESGEMDVYVQYVDKDNAFPSSFPHTVYTEWVRADEGDRVTREADRLTAWEPSESDVEAANLLPDHLLEDPTTDYSDPLGTRGPLGPNAAAAIVPKDDGANVEGVAYVRFTRSGVYGGSDITDGLRWYVPFRGAGDYTLSGCVKDLGGVTSTDSNYVYADLYACDSGRNRIQSHGFGWWQNRNYRGWYFGDMTASVGDTETDGDGDERAVEWLEVHLFMARDGDMAVSRLCLSKCGHATLWDAQERSEARGNEAAQLATGVDIYNRLIRVTSDRFEWVGNSGDAIASFDKDRGAEFSGHVSARSVSTSSGRFSVGEDGRMSATDASIEGTVTTGDPTGRHATLSDGAMRVHGDDGALVTEHTGETFSSVAQLLPGSGQSLPWRGDARCTTDTAQEDGAVREAEATLMEATTMEGTGTLTIAFTTLEYAVSFVAEAEIRAQQSCLMEVSVLLDDLTAGESYVAYRYVRGESAYFSESVTPPPFSKQVTAGHSYSITLRSKATYHISWEPGAAASVVGAYVTARCVLGGVSFSGEAYFSKFFGNGIMIANATDQYFAVMMVDGKLVFECRNGDGGWRLDDGGPAYMTGGSWRTLA